MPILHDRIKDQLTELLPNYMAEEGQGFQTFLEAYFDYLEKGILVFKEGTDLEVVGLETGEGSLLQEEETYSPSPVAAHRFVYEKASTGIIQSGGWEVGEYVVGSISGATARIDVLGNKNNKLYIELFTEAHFLLDEEIVGQNSGYTAKVNSYKGNALSAANNLLSYADVDKTTGDFLNYFREDFMPSIDQSVIADKRILAKHINEIYSTKGNYSSYSFLFRILYGEDISIAYPQDNVINPSDSGWTEPEVLHLYSTKNLLDYPLGRVIKRNAAKEVITNIQVDKLNRVTGGEGENTYSIRVETPFLGTLNIGDEVEVQSRADATKYHLATVRGITGDISTTDGAVYIYQENRDGVVGSESDNSEGFLLETGTDLTSDTSILLLEDATHWTRHAFTSTANQTKFSIGNHDCANPKVYANVGGEVVLVESTDATNGWTTNSDGITFSTPRSNGDTIIVWNNATDPVLNEVHGKKPIPVLESVNTTSTIAVVGGGMYSEEISDGTLYTVSENVTVNLPSSELGVGLLSKTLVGETRDGGIEQVIIDPANRGTGYADGNLIVFDNRDTGGTMAYGEVSSTSGNMFLESGTTFGSLEYTATAGQVLYSGLDNHNHMMVYDPEKVEVYVKRADATQSIAAQGGNVTFSVFELVEGDANITLTGHSVEFTGDYADSTHAKYAGGVGTVVWVMAQPDDTNIILEAGTGEGNLIYDQSGASPTGSIRRATVNAGGVGYTSLPKTYVGGEVFYTDTGEIPLSTNTAYSGKSFQVGEYLTNAGETTTWGVILEHDSEIRKLVVGKLSDSTETTAPAIGDIVRGASTDIEVTVKNSSLTTGTGAQLIAFGNEIGSIGKLRVVTEGNHFNKSGGIPNYEHKMIVGEISAVPTTSATLTGNISGATGTIESYDGDRHLLTVSDITGMFKEGEVVTASDSKTFKVLRSNPATARATNTVVAKIDGNYTDDKGFPSVTSQRIHDSYFYQDFSYVIKVGRSINQYRSIVKQLLNPAGTIFFGEVAISQEVDSRADIYNANFDGTKTTRSFIPILYIGSKIDPAKIILEDGTETGQGTDTFYGTLDNITLESGEGVLTSERFLVNDRMELKLESDSMSPAGSFDFTVGEYVYQNQFKTTSGDLSTLRMKVVAVGDWIADSGVGDKLTVESILPDHAAIKQYLLEDDTNHNYDFDYQHFTGWITPYPSIEAWENNQTSEAANHMPWGIVGESSGKKAEVATVRHANVKKDQASGQAWIVGQTITETDVGLYDRIVRASVQAGGHEVIKELEIMPHYAHHRMYYTTLDNTLPIGTIVKGATSGVQARVMEHNTEDKYFILWIGATEPFGSNVGNFTTEAIKNLALTTTYFTPSKVEIHHPFEDEPKEQIQTEPVTAVSGKTATEGGAEPYDHSATYNETYVESPQNIGTLDTDNSSPTYGQYLVTRTNEPLFPSGHVGRGKVLPTNEPNEFYDTVMKQRTKNIIVTQTFASAAVKSGKTLAAVPSSKEDMNQQGLRGQGAYTSLLRVGGLEWGESIKNAGRDSIINNHNTDTFRTVSDNTNWGSYDHHGLQSGVGHLPIPSDSKRINSVLIGDAEQIVMEDGSRFVAEPDEGFLMMEPEWEEFNANVTTDGKQYYNNGWTVDPTEELTLEDGGRLALEVATDNEDVVKFMTERTPNFASMFINNEDNGRVVMESGNAANMSGGINIESGLGGAVVQELAESVVGEERISLGPTMGDLSKIGFSSTLEFEERIRQESGNAANNVGGVNTETGKGDLVLAEDGLPATHSDYDGAVGFRLLIERPYEGITISDISTLYGNISIGELEKQQGKQGNLTFSASIQSGA